MDDLLDKIAREQDVDPNLVRALISYEQTKVHLEKRRGAVEALRRMIEDHLTEEER